MTHRNGSILSQEMGIRFLLTLSASNYRLIAAKALPATLLLTGLATRASAMGVGK